MYEMFLTKNANLSKNNEGVKLEKKHFIQIFQHKNQQREYTFSAVPPGFEGLYAEELPRHLVIQLGKQEEVAGGQVRTVGGVVHHLYLLLGGHKVLTMRTVRCPSGG